jgi:hypothetical protein
MGFGRRVQRRDAPPPARSSIGTTFKHQTRTLRNQTQGLFGEVGVVEFNHNSGRYDKYRPVATTRMVESVDRLNPLRVGHLDVDHGRLKVGVKCGRRPASTAVNPA